MVSKLVVNRNWFRFGFGFRCFGFSALSAVSALSAEIHQLWPKIALDTLIITLLANLAETSLSAETTISDFEIKLFRLSVFRKKICFG